MSQRFTPMYSTLICHSCGCMLAHKSEHHLCEVCEQEFLAEQEERENEMECPSDGYPDEGFYEDNGADTCDECGVYVNGGGLCFACEDCSPEDGDDEEEDAY